MNYRRAALAWLSGSLCASAFAHRAPNSFVHLDFGAEVVSAELFVPESELAFALVAADRVAALPEYLRQHVAVETPQGTPWTLVIRAVRKTMYLDHDYLVAQIELTPPAGTSTRELVLIDDAITHEVRNHVVIVTQRGAEPRVLGALQYPARRLDIAQPRPRPTS
jgi:hypothetical protein